MRNGWERLAPWLGVAFIVLLAVTIVVGGEWPLASASGAKVVSWYTAHRGSALVSSYLIPLVILLGMLFYGHLRDRIAEGSSGLAATAFGGAVLFAVSGAVSSGIRIALAEHPGSLAPGTAHTLNLIGNYVANIALSGGVSLLLVAAGVAIVRNRQLPAWTGWLGVLLGLTALAPIQGLVTLLAAIWTLIVSVAMIRRAAVVQTTSWTTGAAVTKAAG